MLSWQWRGADEGNESGILLQPKASAITRDCCAIGTCGHQEGHILDHNHPWVGSSANSSYSRSCAIGILSGELDGGHFRWSIEVSHLPLTSKFDPGIERHSSQVQPWQQITSCLHFKLVLNVKWVGALTTSVSSNKIMKWEWQNACVVQLWTVLKWLESFNV